MRLVKGSSLDLVITMKSYYGQTAQQQEAQCAFYWGNLTAQADKQRRLQKCWEMYLNGEVESPLFIDSQRRALDAIDWAYKPVFESGDYTRRDWLNDPDWETGCFCDHSVIVFPRFQRDGAGNVVDVKGATLYDLDGRKFGDGEDWIELDRRGRLIIDGDLPEPARPLDVPLKTFLKGLDFMLSHNGRTPQEVAATRRRVQERARQFREDRIRKELNKR